MYLTNKANVSPVKGSPSRNVSCGRCGNTAEQSLLRWEEGMFIRFAGMHVAGKWAYGYACPVCSEVSDILTKDQAKSLSGT